MGYALWIDGDLAWAEGAHEYRAWGSAVVSVSTSFQLRDFRRHPGKRLRHGKNFVGLFPSLEEVNYHLRQRRMGRKRTRSRGAAQSHLPAFLA